MFLKRIEIKGFKSFADKVEFELDRGITGVVGPNGSGKSNISDAVRWVLGEQSAKSLRGGKMEDVIFAGTDLRKPLGFAEVSITIDNADHTLPVDYSEVTVTRRMYRSGESEYYINKTSCRLKDVTELFMDTGIGRDGYSIIGQGRIDEILSAKAEDRREIFEEAAGIVKYKSRKQESEKKLESTEQNIVRIDDIINELENQIEPLGHQAANARRYLDMREELKALELNLCIRNIDKLKDKIGGLDENYSNLNIELAENNSRTSSIDEEYTSLKNSMKYAEERIEHIQRDIYTSNNEVEKLQGEINVLNEKAANIDKNMQRLDDEIDKEKQYIEKLGNSLKENKSELLASSMKYENELRLLGQKNSEFESVNSSISQKSESIEGMKSEAIELLNMIADKKSSINSYTAFKNNIEKRKSQINAEKLDKENELIELKNGLIKLDEEANTYREKYSSVTERIGRFESERSSASIEKKSLEKNIFELNGRMQSRKARYRMLHEMEIEFEGYNKSVKEIMKLKNSGRNDIEGICGVIADLIHVPAKYEVAIEVALGAALQNIVTEDENCAKNCIEFLKTNKYGRATFLPLTTIKAKDGGTGEKQLKNSKGFIGFANGLISYEKIYYNIISSLLGRVVVVDNLDNGMAIAKVINYSMKIVTLEGDIINPGGAFTGGSLSQKSVRILGRKREIEDLEKEIDGLEALLKAANNDKNKIDEKLHYLEDSIKKAIEEKHSLEIQISSCGSKHNQINADISRIGEELKTLDVELSQLDMEYDEASDSIVKDQAELKELEDRNSSLARSVQEQQLLVKDILDHKENLNLEITSIKVRLAECKQEISTLKARMEEIESDIESGELAIDGKLKQKAESAEEKNSIYSDIKVIEDNIKSINKKCENMKNELEGFLNEKKKDAVIIGELEQKKKEYEEAAASLQGEMHRLEIQKAKLEMELDSIQKKIWDDYEISYAEALKFRQEIDNISQASKDIARLKEEIKSLGTVNVGAIEEYKKVKERYEFLSKQRYDLEEAKESLEKVILEMTDKMKSQFTKNFGIIKENFNTTFQQLFGGGMAELILSDEGNVLESGVEIVAQPPGKKLQSLMLLSGGEKALTAIALLFAILKMKPSPFCILDEIEAALDDINVARYSRFLREFSKKTQFIIVTHRKGSMEASDALYGVTMEEKGVSRVVSVKLSEKAS